jgi:general secretion pathway protein D
MPRSFILAACLLLSGLPAAGSDAADVPGSVCPKGAPGGTTCFVSKQDRKDAHRAFEHGLKLERKQQFKEAFEQFDQASKLVPGDTGFLAAREMVKAQLVFEKVGHGDGLLAAHHEQEAAATFRSALELDPDNQYARQRMEAALRGPLTAVGPFLPKPLSDPGLIQLQPKNDLAAIHYRGDVRGLYAQFAAAYGVTATFDDSVTARPVRFDADRVDFFTALRLVGQVTKTMTSALDAAHFLVLTDTPENHKQFDRMLLQTFQLPPHTTVQEGNDMVQIMRNMFDLRFVTSGTTAGTVDIRAAQWQLAGLTELLEQMNTERPQVMLDISVYQIDHTLLRNIGVHVPNQFNLYNIPAGALAALGGQNIGDLINQLISSGGINQAGSGALAGILAQLGGGQTSIFSQPLATFGGGLTFSGLSLDQLTVALSTNESWARSLDQVNLRTSQGNDATFHLGTRYPIINATFAPIANSAAISQVLGNQSYIPPVPSVSYEDIGFNMKAKPFVNGNGEIRMDLEMQVRALTGDSSNGIPVISNREYKGSLSVPDGQPTVVASALTNGESHSLSGIPGLGAIPGLNRITSTNTVQNDQDELLIIITPHVIANHGRKTEDIWLTGK